MLYHLVDYDSDHNTAMAQSEQRATHEVRNTY
jgi:hypothetical protein